jgi:hypothetical protein
VAICVLSPISTRKKAMVVATNAPTRPAAFGPLVGLVGISAQPAMAMNIPPTIHRIASGPSQPATAAPTEAAMAWLASVATRMPRMIGTGRR